MTMAVANTQTTTTLNDLVPLVPETSEGASNPAAVYLAGLVKTGRRAMAGQLQWVARVVGAESIEAVPWHLLRHEHLVAIRTKAERMKRSPATINLMLAALLTDASGISNRKLQRPGRFLYSLSAVPRTDA
jgi:hypothetical protein